MASEILRLVLTFSGLVVSFGFNLLVQRVQSFVHFYTYRAVPSPLNVVVLGGSFTGIHLARRLANCLPTGYRIVLVERNSHFNYTFNFPRYCVLQGREKKAFIPYSGIAADLPRGSFQQIQDTAVKIRGDEVQLASGERIKFQYLAIATGSIQPLPSKVTSTEKEEGAAELRQMQENVKDCKKIAVVGGGAVGVQLCADIKTFYSEKEITLIHSREQLLPNFGGRLHDHVMEKLTAMGVRVLLNERPGLPVTSGTKENEISLTFKDGITEVFDLVIPCTGQSPNSTIITDLDPEGVSTKSGRIHVKPTLQLINPSLSNIFALGDVAETSGAKMARAGLMQAEIVCANIISLIKGKKTTTILKQYVPHPVEGALKLSLGRVDNVIYTLDGKGGDIMIPGKGKGDDLDVARVWQIYARDAKDFES